MRMMNIKRRIILLFSFMLLLMGVEGATAGPYQYISEIPFFIHFFVLVNIFHLSIATVIIREVKKISVSPVWDDLLMANLINILTI